MTKDQDYWPEGPLARAARSQREEREELARKLTRLTGERPPNRKERRRSKAAQRRSR